jgi:hypothetical protein
VEGLIIPTTFKLQLELDRQEETKTVTSLIEAKFKRDETLTATEATALAIHDVTPSNQNNMEQHIKKLIDEAISKKLSKVATTSVSPSTLTPLKKNEKTPMAARNPKLRCQKTKGEKRMYHSDTTCRTTTTTRKKKKKRKTNTNKQRNKNNQTKNNKNKEPQGLRTGTPTNTKTKTKLKKERRKIQEKEIRKRNTTKTYPRKPKTKRLPHSHRKRVHTMLWLRRQLIETHLGKYTTCSKINSSFHLPQLPVKPSLP